MTESKLAPFKFPPVIRYTEKSMPKWKSISKLGVTPRYILAFELTSKEWFNAIGPITFGGFPSSWHLAADNGVYDRWREKGYDETFAQYWPTILIHPNFDHDNSVLVVCSNSRGEDPPKDQLDDLIAAVRDVAHIHPDRQPVWLWYRS